MDSKRTSRSARPRETPTTAAHPVRRRWPSLRRRLQPFPLSVADRAATSPRSAYSKTAPRNATETSTRSASAPRHGQPRPRVHATEVCVAPGSLAVTSSRDGGPPAPAGRRAARRDHGPGLGWRDLLRGWGYESEIVAEHVHPDLMGAVPTLDRAGRRVANGAPASSATRSGARRWRRRSRRAARSRSCYHNITPGELLRDFNPAVAELCDRGRARADSFAGESTR